MTLLKRFFRVLFVASLCLVCKVLAASIPHVPSPSSSTSSDLPNPNEFCFQCSTRRNHKDHYADPSDCHFYYQCFYINNAVAFGYRRRCPPGTFWRDQVLQCLPEGPTPCEDKCLNDSIGVIGCYAGTGCRQYFMCSNTASYAGCCPEGTAFNPANNCTCERSRICKDACTIRGPTDATTAAPPPPVNSSVCQDIYGNSIVAVEGEPSAFKLIGAGGIATAAQHCPPRLLFDLMTCQCNLFASGSAPRLIPYRKALLWLPFDHDIQDQSVNHYATFMYGNATRDSRAAAVTGGGSLMVRNGWLSIPGLKTQDLRNRVSICLFFRCETGPNESPFMCGQTGGLLSNNKDVSASEYTMILGVKRFNRLVGSFSFWRPIGAKEVNAALHTNADKGWNHFCVTYDGFALRLYVDGALIDEQAIGGFFSIAHCPYVIGTDQSMGNFTGHVDDVLITPFDMTTEEINAHYNGNRNYLISQGFFPQG